MPELEVAYQFDVEGRLEDLFTGGTPNWPDDLEIEWPASIELSAIQYEVEEVDCFDYCWCSDDRCWTGLATADVNGAEMSGRVWYNDSSISLFLELDRPLATLADAGDCYEFHTFEPYLDFHFEKESASGIGFTYLSCQIKEGDWIVALHDAAFRPTLSQAR